MAKRFIDTSIWTQNKWFRKLEPEIKLLWIYLFTNCDAVGVWEEDIELASFVIGYTYSIDSLSEFDGKLKKMNDKKYWIIDFCDFQYGILNEENIKNKPHQSYIKILKNHGLWIDYEKTVNSLKEKEEVKEEDEETEKKKENYLILFEKINLEFKLPDDFKEIIITWLKYKSEKGQSYKETGMKTLITKLLKDSSNNIETATEMIEYSMQNNYAGIFKPKTQKETKYRNNENEVFTNEI
jgi:hypothetical protein